MADDAQVRFGASIGKSKGKDALKPAPGGHFVVPKAGQGTAAQYKAAGGVCGRDLAADLFDETARHHAAGTLTEVVADRLLRDQSAMVEANADELAKRGHLPQMVGAFRQTVRKAFRDEFRRLNRAMKKAP